MSILRGKHILLGITAGIAAYKTASLVRLFIKAGADVKVIMTPAAKDFITPLTLSTLKIPLFHRLQKKMMTTQCGITTLIWGCGPTYLSLLQ